MVDFLSFFYKWENIQDFLFNFMHTKLFRKAIYSKRKDCIEVLWPSQPNGVMSSAISLPNHSFTG